MVSREDYLRFRNLHSLQHLVHVCGCLEERLLFMLKTDRGHLLISTSEVVLSLASNMVATISAPPVLGSSIMN